MVALIQSLGPEPLLDPFIGHVNTVDVEPTVRLRLDSVFGFDLRRISNIRRILSTAPEFHSDGSVGQRLGLEYFDRLLDGFDGNTDVVRVRKVLRVDKRRIGWVGGLETDGSAREVVLVNQEKTGIRVGFGTSRYGLSRRKVAELEKVTTKCKSPTKAPRYPNEDVGIMNVQDRKSRYQAWICPRTVSGPHRRGPSIPATRSALLRGT